MRRWLTSRAPEKKKSSDSIIDQPPRGKSAAQLCFSISTRFVLEHFSSMKHQPPRLSRIELYAGRRFPALNLSHWSCPQQWEGMLVQTETWVEQVCCPIHFIIWWNLRIVVSSPSSSVSPSFSTSSPVSLSPVTLAFQKFETQRSKHNNGWDNCEYMVVPAT